MNRFEWADATSVEQAVELTVEGSTFKAGGVDLLDMMKERLAQPTRLVNLKTIPGMDQIRQTDKGLSIGPLVTLARIAADPIVNQKYTALAQAAGAAATPQVRNAATAGGNLLQRPRCWYFRDELIHCRKKGGEKCYAQEGENQYHAIFNNGLCAIVHPSALATPLVAMGAVIELSGKQKREIPLEEFFVLPSADLHHENSIKPDEVITDIRIPAATANSRSAYLKQGEKDSFDWPLADVAAVIQRDGTKCAKASIVLGAAAPVPHRAKEAESTLAGLELTRENAAAAAEAALASATPLAHNAYKVSLFKTLITRAILATGENK